MFERSNMANQATFVFLLSIMAFHASSGNYIPSDPNVSTIHDSTISLSQSVMVYVTYLEMNISAKGIFLDRLSIIKPLEVL